MDLLISDGGEGGNHHVEAIEPGPSLDEVKAGGAHQRERQQRRPDEPEVAEGFHDASAVGRQSSVVPPERSVASAGGLRSGCRVGLADDD